MARKKNPPPAPDNPDQPEPWRRPSVKRAHERNVVTYLDKVLGDYGKAIRDAKGLSQPEVAERLLLPDGTPHPVTWGWRRRIGTDQTKKEEKTTRDMRAKSISRFEAAELAPTTSLFIAWMGALDVDPGDALKGMGLSSGGVSVESAVMADRTLTPDAKQAMLVMYRQLQD